MYVDKKRKDELTMKYKIGDSVRLNVYSKPYVKIKEISDGKYLGHNSFGTPFWFTDIDVLVR